ncbi:MAG: TraR/DksA family transcriptional regulator, partial [Acidimicrobiia bacterium]
PQPQPKPKPKKSPFDKRQLEGIRKNLEEMAVELKKELEEIEEAAFNVSQSEMSGEVGYDEDYADSGSFTFEREKDLSIANNVQDLLDKINRAIEKIDEGTYGVCEVCGNLIEPARVKALPHALLCVRDKALEERR